MNGAYYNEFDANKAAWLRELIKAGAIADGEVDERSISDVQPNDLAGFTQCHFFAGIGIWSYALRLAGWPDDKPVWTASCPCQPFSQAGKREGTADRRHLWPDCYRLIRERQPVVLFGEQVQSPDGLAWLDIVSTDLEGSAYTIGACGLCSASLGAPHARNRLFFVAHTMQPEIRRRGLLGPGESVSEDRIGETSDQSIGSGAIGIMGHSNEAGRQGRSDGEQSPNAWQSDGIECATGEASVAGIVGNAEGSERRLPVQQRRPRRESSEPSGAGPVNGYWSNAEWIYCRPERPGEAGKYRPVEPAAFGMDDELASDLGCMRVPCLGSDEGREVVFPLIQKGKARVQRLRGYGDGIVAELAAEFIVSCLDAQRATA